MTRQTRKRSKKPDKKYSRKMRTGGADRTQDIDLVFFKTKLNPKTRYDPFIVHTKAPKYIQVFDVFKYQFEDIERDLQVYSTGKPFEINYITRVKVKSNRAKLPKTQEEKDRFNKKISRMQGKIDKLKELEE
jgi:hypothetical protein